MLRLKLLLISKQKLLKLGLSILVLVRAISSEEDKTLLKENKK
jgi:hypothetical protein